jgi:hypothetical protein
MGTSAGGAEWMPVPALRPGLSMEIRKPLGDTLLLAARAVSVPELSAATSMAGRPRARHRAEAPAWAQVEEDLVAAVVEEDMAGAAGTGDRKLVLFMASENLQMEKCLCGEPS